MAMPIVSIILCTYNGEKYLSEQLESLERQTYDNLEIIASDNNSTDGTAQILKDWCAKKENRKFYNSPELGLNKNYFSAIQKATGEYVMFCDQDDIWLENKVEELLNFYQQNPTATLVYCLSKPFSGAVPTNSNVKGNINYLEGNNIRKTLLISFTLGHNMCIKRSILQQIPIPTNENVAFDWWITVSAMCLGNITCLPEVLTYWRQHNNNTTQKIIAGKFYAKSLCFLTQFLNNTLICKEDKIWINRAISKFKHLEKTNFSIALFLFLLKNAPQIFFYKTKVNPVLKWISYTKWSFRMSRRNHE